MEPPSKEIKCYSWSLHHKAAHILRNYFKNYNPSLPSHQAEYKVLIFHPRISSFPCRSRQVVLELTEQDSQTPENVGCLWHWSSVQSRELIRLRKKETLRTEGNLFTALDSVGKYSELSSVCVKVCLSSALRSCEFFPLTRQTASYAGLCQAVFRDPKMRYLSVKTFCGKLKRGVKEKTATCFSGLSRATAYYVRARRRGRRPRAFASLAHK